jgi:hypothetical protein
LSSFVLFILSLCNPSWQSLQNDPKSQWRPWYVEVPESLFRQVVTDPDIENSLHGIYRNSESFFV